MIYVHWMFINSFRYILRLPQLTQTSAHTETYLSITS